MSATDTLEQNSSPTPTKNGKRRVLPKVGVWVQGNDYGRPYTLEAVIEATRLAVVNPATTTHVMVGTDSHSYGAHYHFVTVVCLWNEGKGGTYFYQSALEPRKTYHGSQKLRLQDEVTKSLAVAYEIEKALGIKPEVHVDCSPPGSKEFSATFAESLRGYVLSSGYLAILKPDSIASNAIADRHTRKRTRRRKRHYSEKIV